MFGVPAVVAQWVKNPAAAAPVTVKAQVQSPAGCSGLKDLALPQLWRGSKMQFRFDLWPRNLYMLQMWQKGRKEGQKEGRKRNSTGLLLEG